MVNRKFTQRHGFERKAVFALRIVDPTDKLERMTTPFLPLRPETEDELAAKLAARQWAADLIGRAHASSLEEHRRRRCHRSEHLRERVTRANRLICDQMHRLRALKASTNPDLEQITAAEAQLVRWVGPRAAETLHQDFGLR